MGDDRRVFVFMPRSANASMISNLTSYTVLVVGLVIARRELYCRYLQADASCRYILLEADAATTALAVCRDQAVDGILVDETLSDATGLEFVQALRRQFDDTNPPVVMVAGETDATMTASVAVQLAVRAMQAGVEDYLVKQDLTPEQLQLAMRHAIQDNDLQNQRSQVSHDQNERSRIQELNCELSDRVNELQTLIDITPVGIAIATDATCRQMQCNACMRQLLDVRSGHNISKSAPAAEQPAFRVFQDGQEMSTENLPMQTAARLGIDVRDVEIEIRSPDGTARQLLSYATPLRGDQHEIRGVVGAFLDITERNRMEAILRNREATIRQQLAELESIYATAPVGLCFQDRNLRYVRINDRLAEINGVSAANHLGRTTREVLPELADTVEPLHRHVIETGEPILNVEIRGMTKAQPHGERDWIASYYPLKDADGCVLGVNVVVQDITEAKQAAVEREQLLRQLEMERSFLEQTLQQMPSGVAIAEVPSGKLLFYNDEAIRLIRHPMKMTETYDEYTQYGAMYRDGQPYQPQDYPIARALLTGEVVKAEEMSYRRGDGTSTIFSVNAAPIIDQNGQRIAAVSTFEDISERKQADRDRRLMARIVESSSDAIMGLTLDCRIISWNAAAERIFGYTAAEIVGQDLMMLVPRDRTAEPGKIFAVVRQGEVVSQFETVRQRKDGSLVDVAITVSPIKNTRNEVIGIAGTVRDITTQKQLEREREQLLEQAQAARNAAEAANDSKDEFVAMVAHELRSPLNAIMGWAKLLQARQYDAVTTQKALETIVRNTEAQVQLVEDLLDISRMVHGTLQLTITGVNFRHVIETALETIRPMAETKQLQLKSHIKDVATIPGDFNRLQQVVLNLLTNAIKFTAAGGQIEIVLAQSPAQVELQIRDTGKGIHPDFLPYIFERFRQDQHNTTAKQGLGLGLTIVKHLVEMHGGKVRAASAGEWQGATFTVSLPLPESEKVGETGMQAEVTWGSDLSHVPLAALTHPPLTDVRVLLVDDEPDMLDLAAFILEESGAVVQTATSVISALELVPQFQPNLVLSDIAMPDQDGYELLRRLRSLYPEDQIPAIALTAYASESRREKSLQVGFQQHLTKPVEPQQLVAAVLSAIASRRT